MTWSRTISIYIDIDRPGGQACVLNGTQGGYRASPHGFMQGDKFTLRVYPRTVSSGIGALTTSVQLAAGSKVVFSAKASAASSTTLFGIEELEAPGSPTDPYYYEGLLDLNTAELATALGSAQSLNVVADVEIQNADNSERLSFRIPITITAQVYDNELPPVAPGSELEIIGGVAYFEKIMLKSDSGLYHEVTLHTAGGATTLRIEKVGETKP